MCKTLRHHLVPILGGRHRLHRTSVECGTWNYECSMLPSLFLMSIIENRIFRILVFVGPVLKCCSKHEHTWQCRWVFYVSQPQKIIYRCQSAIPGEWQHCRNWHYEIVPWRDNHAIHSLKKKKQRKYWKGMLGN